MSYTTFDFRSVPCDWTLCFIHNCPLKATCMRYFVGEQVPMSETWGSAVYPTALQGNVCKHYFEKRVIRVAWGFDMLFSEVKRKDDVPLREQIKEFLGGHGTYYCYMHGKRMLNPEQQAWILDLFRSYGYTTNLVFDHYANFIDFG